MELYPVDCDVTAHVTTPDGRASHEHPIPLRPVGFDGLPPMSDMPQVTIVGAGLSGLACARRLGQAGLRVTVLEKSRGVGGRMATRRAGDSLRFDHGAQYFTVRDPQFGEFVDDLIQRGIVARWEGAIVVLDQGRTERKQSATERHVAVPGMNAICKHLAEGLTVVPRQEVALARRAGESWRLEDRDGGTLAESEWLVVSAPAPQAARLLEASPPLRKQAAATPMQGCWAVMAAFTERLDVAWDGAFVHHSELSWVARDSSKPGRDAGRETWVLHGSAEWSEPRLDESPEAILPQLLEAFGDALGQRLPAPEHAAAHRWRYAIPPDPLEQACLLDAERQAGACGDWCGGPRVEGAYLSGVTLAEEILAQLP